MTVSTLTSRVQFSPNGVSVLFPVSFKFLDETDLVVILTDANGVDSTLTYLTDYTVAGAGDESGGSITTIATYATGTKLTIYRDLDATQNTDYVANDSFPAETHEDALDKLTMLIQELEDELGRTIQFPASEALATNNILPEISTREDQLLGFDSDGDVTLYTLSSLTIAAGAVAITIGTPSGTATTKSITVSVAGNNQPLIVKAWLVDGSNTVPTLVRSLTPLSSTTLRDFEELTSGGSASFSFTHEGSSTTWKVCFSVGDAVFISSNMTLGV